MRIGLESEIAARYASINLNQTLIKGSAKARYNKGMDWKELNIDVDTLPRNGTGVVAFDVDLIDKINVDPRRFQYKSGGDSESGVTDRYRDVTKFVSEYCDPVFLWLSKDGELFLADGHQRMGIWGRARASGQKDGLILPVIIYKESDGISAEQMKVKAAERNIAQGSGKAIDAAVIIRNHGPLPKGISEKSAVVSKGKLLALLPEEVFCAVGNGRISEEFGTVIADVLRSKLIDSEEKRSELAIAIMNDFIATKPKTSEEAYFYAHEVVRAGAQRAVQPGLFGDEEVVASLRMERLKILQATQKIIKSRSKLCKTLLRNQQVISDDFDGKELDFEKAKVELDWLEISKKILNKGWFPGHDETGANGFLDEAAGRLQRFTERGISDEATQKFIVLLEPSLNKYAAELKAVSSRGEKGDGAKLLTGITRNFLADFQNQLKESQLGQALYRSMSVDRERPILEDGELMKATGTRNR